MLRSSLLAASAIVLVTSVSAQSTSTPRSLQARRLPGPVRDAGIYHVPTGTWTRTGGAVDNIGPDVIYSNTAAIGYWSTDGLNGPATGPNPTIEPGSTVFDEGGIPGPTNGDVTGVTLDRFTANGFRIGYCDINVAPSSSGWRIEFYEEYTHCTDPTALTPIASITATGLPTSSTECWAVTIDLTGGSEFCIGADGAMGTWQDNLADDQFGWSIKYAGAPGNGAEAGFLLAGAPDYTDPFYVPFDVARDGTGTYYGPPSLCPDIPFVTGTFPSNSGFYSQDGYWLAAATNPFNTDCYFFGGYRNLNGCAGFPQRPFGSFYMELMADLAVPCGGGEIGSEYCQSNPNSTTATTDITVTGSTSVATDDVTLTASSMPTNAFGYFITSQTQGFVANPAGSEGNLCLAGNLGRFVAPIQVKNSGPQGEISISTLAGEWSTGAIPTPVGPYAAVAGTTTNFQAWHRDVNGSGVPSSNFSNADAVTWTN
ncbi:MAG: hypothetical protein AAGB93_07785 [Planctomycetota bacterium]